MRRLFFRFFKQPKLIILVVCLMGIFAVYLMQVDRVEFYKNNHRKIQFISKLSNVFYLPLKFTSDKLDDYYLEIDRDDWDFLNKNLPETYSNNLLLDDYKKDVDAKLTIDSKQYDVKVRYRGDTDIHWRDSKKSWFLDFKKTDLLNGSEKYHLIIPFDRFYLLEELNFYRAKKAGLLVPETKLVNFFVNDKRQGVYWQVEHFNQALLEKNNISGETNLYGSVDFSSDIKPGDEPFEFSQFWRKYVGKTGEIDDYSELSLLIEIINKKDQQEFNRQIVDIVDMENFYQWQINQYLVSSTHQTGINTRFYFDPTAGKFRFIAWDVSIGETPPEFLEENYNKLVTRILQNPEFLHERNKILWSYVADKKNLEDDLDFYDNLDKLTKNDFYKDFKKVQSNLAYRGMIRDIRKKIEEKFLYLQNNLKNSNAFIIVSGPKNKVDINIATDGFSSVKINKISFNIENCNQRVAIYKEGNYLKDFSCQDGKYEADLDLILYSVKVLQDSYLAPGYNEMNFTFESISDINKEFNFDLANAVTGDKVEPSIINL